MLEPLGNNLVEILRRRAQEHPDKVAYIFLEDGEKREDPLTYGELDRRARAIAAQLVKDGLTGERALLLYPPGLDFIGAFFWLYLCWRDCGSSLSTRSKPYRSNTAQGPIHR